jgi:hypothetical protein
VGKTLSATVHFGCEYEVHYVREMNRSGFNVNSAFSKIQDRFPLVAVPKLLNRARQASGALPPKRCR